MTESTGGVPNINAADRRLHQALADNRCSEVLMILMAPPLLCVAFGMFVLAYQMGNPVLLLGAFLLAAVFCGAIRQILAVRRERSVLEPLPVIIRVLPPGEAAVEMMSRLRSVGITY